MEARSPAGQRVWNVACDLFYREGIRSVGVAEIAERSGVGKPSIYRNFESKDRLAVAYVEAQAAPPRTWLEEARAACPDDPSAQLEYVIGAIADRISEPDFRGCPLANACVEFPDREHPVHRKAGALKAEYLEMLVELVAPLPVRDPQGLAYMLQMLVEGANVTTQIFSADRSAAALKEAATRIIRSYLDQ
ncbi:TetR/AcrR family transcriptional regulator [Streptomyces smyrnaeus]|uniref:TetR/AcrR family transcriptional regulator n=1 Tax=Streptomyces TaxID=1883 RepID=UPI001B36A81F|nr:MULTISPECIES: TetR/AcrR family transcriptional regulator [unclassified Streptomyces]MBQ0867114.1 TetR/AcrR family transcriptional regulator [Streptomyces sp. RK75]MBQ1121179.1 TetR/AcrR family transcriptional regulator [Streptomyces sp. B15]